MQVIMLGCSASQLLISHVDVQRPSAQAGRRRTIIQALLEAVVGIDDGLQLGTGDLASIHAVLHQAGGVST